METKNPALPRSVLLLKLRVTLRDKCFVCFAIIRMLHADGLCLRFAFECRLKIHVELAIEHPFCFAESECGSARQFVGEGSCSCCQITCRHDAIVKPDALRFSSADEISREEHLRSFRESDHARQ